MLEFLEQMPGYEWQIGIGFLLLLTGAAAGSWGLATLRAAILPLRPELYRIVRNLPRPLGRRVLRRAPAILIRSLPAISAQPGE
jgi:hypothetical protein